MPNKFVGRIENWNEIINDKIADSWFGRYFRLDGSGELMIRNRRYI